MKKRLKGLSVGLSLVMVLGVLVGCGGEKKKETEGKKFDSNNFNFLTDKNIDVKDDNEFSFKDITSKLLGMFKSTPEETEKIG